MHGLLAGLAGLQDLATLWAASIHMGKSWSVCCKLGLGAMEISVAAAVTGQMSWPAEALLATCQQSAVGHLVILIYPSFRQGYPCLSCRILGCRISWQ